MKVLVCGSRNYTDMWAMEHFIYGLPEGTIIVEGEARGADTIARVCAERRALEVRKYPAAWSVHEDCHCGPSATYCKAAGPRRNKLMLEEEHPDKVVAFTLSLATSKGTRDMVERAHRAGIPVEVRP